MALITSTGLAAHLMVTGSAKDAFDGGLIKVYSGTAPATADDAVTGTLLWTISVNGAGTGITFESAAVDRSLVKETTETWSGATTAGTASYWRLVASGDTGVSSTSQKRIQGTCGSTGSPDLFMSSTTLTTDASTSAKTLASFSITLPAS